MVLPSSRRSNGLRAIALLAACIYLAQYAASPRGFAAPPRIARPCGLGAHDMEPRDSTTVACSGWLQKRCAVLRDTWQPHWCIVRSASLTCYEDQYSEVAKATWDISSAQISAFW
ncbi:hypothetical protein AK812_SmicGene7103 [Symbiodinium microadriaticum]|uniref:PH domain-containing protein n=1 Tax=Symbiodinium microadriaticum TaxID=2951 RepID=A0A1Q9EPG4_SYMMI|nr:hypothetical protein AK812_SmicGene7103 [Symbiodinium microadriaticum]